MKLLTKEIRDNLLKNGLDRDRDHAPVVKLFNPVGSATWLFSELDSDGDTLFGLCDLGMGEPELGYASLRELSSIRLKFGLGIERDIHWSSGGRPMSEWAAAAREKGQIVSYLPDPKEAAAKAGSVADLKTIRELACRIPDAVCSMRAERMRAWDADRRGMPPRESGEANPWKTWASPLAAALLRERCPEIAEKLVPAMERRQAEIAKEAAAGHAVLENEAEME